MAVLLPEQPLVHLGPQERVLRQQCRVLRQEEQHRVGLGQRFAAAEIHGGDLPRRVHRQEFRSPAFARHDVYVDERIDEAEPVRRIDDLQAVARTPVTIERESGRAHARFSRLE